MGFSGVLRQPSRRGVGRFADLGRAARRDRLGLFHRIRLCDLTGPIQQVLILHRLMFAEDCVLNGAVRFRGGGQQSARRGILTVDVLQGEVEISLRGSPARRPARRNVPKPQAALRLRTVAARHRTIVQKQRLHRLRKRFDGAARHPSDHPVQFIVRGAGRQRLLAVAFHGRQRFHCHFQAMLQRGDHRVLRVGGRGVGQFDGG